jgi:hypothetical protein
MTSLYPLFAFVFGVVSYLISTGKEESSIAFFKGDKIGILKIEGAILSSEEAIEDIQKMKTSGISGSASASTVRPRRP